MTHPFPTRRSSDLINWTTQALTADGPAFFGRYWLGAQPWENHELYWSRSPLSLVGNVGATMGPAENQARDRGRAALKAQIAAIAQAPDYDLVSDSPNRRDRKRPRLNSSH